jgi:hypothetical protein
VTEPQGSSSSMRLTGQSLTSFVRMSARRASGSTALSLALEVGGPALESTAEFRPQPSCIVPIPPVPFQIGEPMIALSREDVARDRAIPLARIRQSVQVERGGGCRTRRMSTPPSCCTRCALQDFVCAERAARCPPKPSAKEGVPCDTSTFLPHLHSSAGYEGRLRQPAKRRGARRAAGPSARGSSRAARGATPSR